MKRQLGWILAGVVLAALLWREWSASQWMTATQDNDSTMAPSRASSSPVAEPSSADVEQLDGFCHLCVLEDAPGYLSQYANEPGWALFVETARRGAARGEPDAQYQLGMAYLYGASIEEDRAKAFEQFAAAASSRHPKASYWHANALYNAHAAKTGQQYGTPEARRFMQVAADGGVTQAMGMLAAYYENVGEFTDAARYHRQAADAGATCARYSLAMLYLDGKGVQQDVAHAIELLKADKECSNPIFELADIYTSGKYVPKDFGAAVASIAHGTLPGHKARAAKLYETGGPGLKPDQKMALKLYREAVEAGGDLFKEDIRRLEASQ